MIKPQSIVNSLQYLAMLLMSAVMPFGWLPGLWVAYVLAGASIVKAFVERRLYNPTLNRPMRVALYCMIGYWLVHFLGLALSEDVVEAWDIVGLKASLLIAPLCLLLTDTSYLSSRHVRGLGYALVLGVCSRFLYRSACMAVAMHNGSTFAQVTSDWMFDPIHHAYSALYIVTAMLYVYYELSEHWHELKGWVRGLLIAAVFICEIYIFIVNSRTGMICMWMLAVACMLHLAWHHRRWKMALLVMIVLVANSFVIKKVLSGHHDRVAETVAVVQKEGQTDSRVTINIAALNTLKVSPGVGLGLGDYRKSLTESLNDCGYYRSFSNAHNQYMETALGTGLVGLLFLLAFLAMPLLIAWRWRLKNWFYIMMLTGIVTVNLLFESMLERQMGLLFIAWIYAFMVLIISFEKNKFVRSDKK